MKLITTSALALAIAFGSTNVSAEQAKSPKQAKKVTELRQSLFSLMGSNMGPLGGMARGKMPFDAKKIEKHAMRINQLSLMIGDYLKADTSAHKVETEALNKIWQQPEEFSTSITKLTKASANLQKLAMSGADEKAIKKAISGVGRSCGGCHDNFKKD